MLFLLFLQKYISFPEKSDAILQKEVKAKRHVNIESSGSLGLYFDGKCHKTYGNETIHENEDFDWCSNIASEQFEKAWIQYSIPNKAIKIKGYSLRNGCCKYACCCYDDQNDINYCCCNLYSFSLLGSNDNETWKLLHKVEKDSKFYYCSFKTYELDAMSDAYKYIRLVQDAEYPGCPKCMQINQIEFYGETIVTGSYSLDSNEDEEESISIIGRVKDHH